MGSDPTSVLGRRLVTACRPKPSFVLDSQPKASPGLFSSRYFDGQRAIPKGVNV